MTNAACASVHGHTVLRGDGFAFPTRMLHRSHPNRSDRDRRAVLYLHQPAERPHLDETHPIPRTPGEP
jgi:hypothetical protein